MEIIPTYTNPKLHDSVIQSINDLLVDYVEYRYGSVHVGYDESGETYPSVYKNDGSRKNYMLFPDNRVKSFGFWELNDSDVLDDDDGVIYDLTFVFWGNLERIDSTKYYDFTSEIAQSIVQLFKNYGATAITYTQDDIFSEYSKYLEQDKQTLMRPNTGFKINMKIHDFIC